MLILELNDSIEVITSAAVTVDFHASYMDCSQGTPGTTAPIMSAPDKSNKNITTATTTASCVPTPASGYVRNVKQMILRNKHASTSVDITVQFNQNATIFELIKVTLRAGETLEYVEGVGWFVLANAAKLDTKLYVTADSVHATAATFADITGLTVPVESGKNYGILAELQHISNATTTGAQFALGGVAMTGMQVGTIDTVTGSVTAGVMSTGAVAAINTAITAQTTGSAAITLAHIAGWFQPSASGTFALRATSEVTVASGLTVKKGSWMRVWEFDN